MVQFLCSPKEHSGSSRGEQTSERIDNHTLYSEGSNDWKGFAACSSTRSLSLRVNNVSMMNATSQEAVEPPRMLDPMNPKDSLDKYLNNDNILHLYGAVFLQCIFN